ncbi:phage tail family protein [Robertmurraya sp. DFI.2.37]|uniref:phage tail family protein n=1 Tax=Robertmurraya sp. DFI.2.37 TaxID=3031819 RepID=UPI0012448E77|nr:phage tail family protein [Robertmurraya sp. DFI.2.37]MDF1510883.1 phage tail family protein [Robertmurraya sp. DFI.2.37]
MERLIFTNARGESVTFGASPPFEIITVDGLGDVSAETISQKSAFQDGSTYIDSTLDERVIEITLLIHVLDYSRVVAARQRLSAVMNPKLGLGTLRYEGGGVIREIQAVAESIPRFPDGTQNRGERFQKVSLTLIAPDPYWRQPEATKTEIALWEPLFEFELEIPEDTGIEFGVRTETFIVNVKNDGHVDTGMIIKFRAIGTVVNPSLFNVNTQEWIKLNYTMTAGEIITINTNRGQKRIESTLNGVTTNIFNSIARGSTFLQLEIGDNLLRYDADENINGLEVDIYHASKYVGV